MTKQRNTLSARSLMFRGSIYGALILSAIGSLNQDRLGRDAYLQLVQTHWVDARMTVPIAICALVIGVVAYFVDAIRATNDELQTAIAKDVTDDDIDRLLPTSLRKSGTFDRTPVDYDGEDHSGKVQAIGQLVRQAYSFELSAEEKYAYLAQSSLLLNSICTTDRVALAWIILMRKQINTLADDLGLTTAISDKRS
jgi:hypothetical protein